MSLTLIALLGIVIMVLLIFMGMNIGIAMILVGTIGSVLVTGNVSKALNRLGTVPFTTMSGASYIVIPLFCLMGEFTLESGMSKGLYDCCA
ncbi:MAG: TRAP transporter large permease subunit, partial [Oscillospiraceae bacterium]|nr:TRAP transporter large permease subunit [Oscillospiraceae bacterium]